MGPHRHLLTLYILSLSVGWSLACFCDEYPWSPWSTCSVTCGGGQTTRSRIGVLNIVYLMKGCYTFCAPHVQEKQCNNQGCSTPCRIGDWSNWSKCDPCVRKQFRSRALLKPAEFGGLCEETEMSSDRPCLPDRLCTIQQTDCANKFLCQNGYCIEWRLKCNGDNNCADGSDEEGCGKKKLECPREVQGLPGLQLIGSGYNALAGELGGEVLNNLYYGGGCNTIRNGSIGILYQVPSNLLNINFELSNLEDDVTDQFYEDASDYESKVSSPSHFYEEQRSSFNIPIIYGRHTSKETSKSSSFKEVIKAASKKDSAFVRVHKTFAVSEFRMKDTNLHVSETFLEALSNLPLEYNYAMYSRIFQDFGTHYFTSGKTGGVYDVLYQYDRRAINNSGLTKSEMLECVRHETVTRVLFLKFRESSKKCTENKMTIQTSGSILESAETSVSMVRGGRAEFAGALAWQKGRKFPTSQYRQWQESVWDNPTVVDFKLRPILGLVKGIFCAVTKRRHLERAMMEFMANFDPCRCSPCSNNGKTVMVENTCMCTCKAGTYGDRCEHRTADYHSTVQDGFWSCWTAWTSCDAAHGRRRIRRCNNPAPHDGGKPCEGAPQEEQHCVISLFGDRSTQCINDNDARREVDDQIDDPDPTGGTVYCRKPKAPDNSSLRVNKRRYEVAEMLEIICFSGFELTGYQFYRCLADGSWHKEDVECQLKVCNRPATSPPATLHPFKTQYSIGEFIRVNCPPRMAPAGQEQYTCGSSLNWEPDPPQEIHCQSVIDTHACQPGKKVRDDQCVCMSAEEDCGTDDSTELCAYDVATETLVMTSTCAYLAKRCERQELQLVKEGQCVDSDLRQAAGRAHLSISSSKREACGIMDTCYDWERCKVSTCACLLPNQCPRDDVKDRCIVLPSGSRMVSLCMLGAMMCRKINVEMCTPSQTIPPTAAH